MKKLAKVMAVAAFAGAGALPLQSEAFWGGGGPWGGYGWGGGGGWGSPIGHRYYPDWGGYRGPYRRWPWWGPWGGGYPGWGWGYPGWGGGWGQPTIIIQVPAVTPPEPAEEAPAEEAPATTPEK